MGVTSSSFRSMPDFTRLVPRANVHRKRQRALNAVKLAGLGAAVGRAVKQAALGKLKRATYYERDGKLIRF